MKIAILIPCYNEEKTIKKVVSDFKEVLPEADIYVYDNNSKDDTYNIALAEGAIVRKEYSQGKGNVIRTMFRQVEADIYVMVDGDDTYPAEKVNDLIKCIIEGKADMVVGDRLSNQTYFKENKRKFHSFGNTIVKKLINHLFKVDLKDIMSGYRAFSYEFVKSFPVLSDGFQVETEMTIFTLDKRLKIREVPIDYKDRPEGSESKLNTFSDGFKVLLTIFNLFRHYKPIVFFSITTLILISLGLIVGIPVISEFISTGFINKIPSAILASSLIVLSVLSFACGLILDTISRNNRILFESKMNEIYRNKTGRGSYE